MKLSQTSKLDGIKSWSLQARDTCPGSLKEGELVEACRGCYASAGNYRFANVRAPREHNRQDWLRDAWEDDMVEALRNERYFRWFDSGDVYALELAKKLYGVMRRTPWCEHWLPTRMYKFKKFLPVFRKMQALPNVMVRFSSDSVMGEFVPGLHGSTIVPAYRSAKADGLHVCEAYNHEGKCNGCRVCWDKRVPVVAYVAHGRAMGTVIKAQSNA